MHKLTKRLSNLIAGAGTVLNIAPKSNFGRLRQFDRTDVAALRGDWAFLERLASPALPPAAPQPQASPQEPVTLLRDAWATLHNLSVDMDNGPIRQQMQKRAQAIRVYLDSIENADGTYATPQPQAAPQEPPQGWVMVPREPTQAMWEAAKDEVYDGWGNIEPMWRVMLAAAPQPQAPSATSDDVRAAIADARDKALEEAAQVCDGITHQYTSSGGHAAERCAAAIRAHSATSGNAIAAIQRDKADATRNAD